MSAVFSKAKRSQVMSRIRSRGNKDTELALASLFRRHGITGWRRQLVIRGRATPPRRPAFRVRPDFAFSKLRVTVFVDGYFWHACPKHANLPANNRVFWKKKLTANQARDRRVNRTLRQAGWHVVRIWEHDLTQQGERCIRRIRTALDATPPHRHWQQSGWAGSIPGGQTRTPKDKQLNRG